MLQKLLMSSLLNIQMFILQITQLDAKSCHALLIICVALAPLIAAG